MTGKLNAAAEAGNINLLYTLIEEDPHVLEHIDGVQFVNTPLHVAASAGHIRFASEIMRLRPSLAWKLNQHGFSPIHLALHNTHDRMVLRFVNINKDLVRVKGREGLTPLHFVTRTGDIDLLAEFLSACPDSIEDVTVDSETALHIAVKNNQIQALQLLIGWLQRTRHRFAMDQEKSILNWKDEAGNTILHISALENDPQAVRLLIDTMIDLNAKNLDNLTALDIVENQTQVDNAEIRNMLLKAGALSRSSLPSSPTIAEKLISKLTLKEKIAISFIRSRRNISNDTRNALLVVAILIATTTYQAALSPPGGISQAGGATQGNEGKVVMDTVSFLGFWFFNTTALFGSILMIYFLLPTGKISVLLFAPLYLFSYCYVWSMAVISPNRGSFIVNLLFLFILSTLFIGGTAVYGKVTKKLGGYRANTENESGFSAGNKC